MPTIATIFKEYSQDIATLDIELLLAHVAKKSREEIIAHPEYILTNHPYHTLQEYIKQRKKGMPLAYITHCKEFYGLDFEVDQHVLIPRPETEILVEKVDELCETFLPQKPLVLIDLGTGSGCIPITLAKKHPLVVRSIAIDNSPQALAVARRNAHAHGVKKNINFLLADLLTLPEEDIKSLSENVLLVITANLPYIPQDQYEKAPLHADTKGILFEPKGALVSGKDGLGHFRRFFDQYASLRKKLPKETIIFCEFFGDDSQRDFFENEIGQRFPEASLSFILDLSGKTRIAKIDFSSS